MKASDLRFGNLINTPAGIQSCIDVMCDGINTKTQEGLGYDFIEGIPITEEWLFKLSFKKKFSYWFPHGCWHRYFFHGYVLNLEPPGCKMVHSQVHYVHELQNLHFALTGTELEIKL